MARSPIAGWAGPLDGPAPGNPLDRDSIAEMIQEPTPLIEDYVSLGQQLQPNGFDFTLRDVDKLVSAGSMGAGTGQREISATETLSFGPDDWLSLAPGPYRITFNEVITLPLDLMALARPRSSLLRSGVSVHTAVWDAGYHGRSEALLVVHHPLGYRLQRDARLVQLIFFRLPQAVSQGYQGRFQGENLR